MCFALGEQELGVPIRAVKETVPLRPITRVFLVPRVLAGLINLRGDVVAVLDLARLLGLEPAAGLDEGDRKRHPDAAIVILRGAEAGRAAGRAACGILVERLRGVCDLEGVEVKPPPPTLDPEAAGYLRGVAAPGAKPLLLLDPERILATETLRPYRREERVR